MSTWIAYLMRRVMPILYLYYFNSYIDIISNTINYEKLVNNYSKKKKKLCFS